MQVTTRINGEIRQDDTTASMMFPFKYIISYFSKFFHLKPGDVIATGTLNGAGALFEPPRYLAQGDVVEIVVMKTFLPSLKEHGLPTQQWRVIRALENENGLEISELAEYCYLLVPSLSRIINHLEKKS